MTVLFLGTYSINDPIHGGQRRSHALFSAIRNNGIPAIYCGVLPKALHPNDRFSQFDFVIDDPFLDQRFLASPLLEDLLLGCLDMLSANYYAKFERFLLSIRPAVIHLEQPYIWPLVRAIVQKNALKTSVVYSSQNVEFEMKREFYRQKMHKKMAEILTNYVKNVEIDLVKHCDLLVAVSSQDAEKFRAIGARSVEVVPNGIDKVTPSSRAIRQWQNTKKSSGKNKWALFVGSAHLPNAEGLAYWLGASLGFIPPDAEIVVVGGVGHLLSSLDMYSGLFSSLNYSRTRIITEISDDDLAAIYHCTDTVILPIHSGGGSNLKTAEALLSGKNIIASEFAFRSFDRFKENPNVTICNNPIDFRSTLKNELNSSIVREEVDVPKGDSHKELETLTWRSITNTYPQKIKNIYDAASVERIPAEIDEIFQLKQAVINISEMNIPKQYLPAIRTQANLPEIELKNWFFDFIRMWNQADEPFVHFAYQLILRRKPDLNGFQSALEFIHNNGKRWRLISVFFRSAEFRKMSKTKIQKRAGLIFKILHFSYR